MNKLMPLFLLLTMVACNDNIRRSTITNHEEVINQYQSGLTVERGTVSIIDKAGYDAKVNADTNKLLSTKVSERSKSVIIHVDGEQVYTYVETKNNVNGTLSKKVVLNIMNPKKEIQNLLNSNHGILSGDHLVIKGTNFDEHEGDTYSLESSNEYVSTFNLNHSLCESTNRESKETHFKNSNGDTQTLTTILNETSVCGTKYTNAQMKKIDLKNIQLCSDDECVMVEDLSWLTQDL